MRKNRERFKLSVKPAQVILALLLFTLAFLIYFIPPVHIGVILLAVILLSLIVYLVSGLFLNRKMAFLISFSVGSLTLLQTLDIFDLLNFIILSSLVASLSILTYQK